MSLFRQPTALVLGAGASADFGLPLGSKLRLDCLAILDQTQRLIFKAGSAYSDPWNHALNEFRKNETLTGRQGAAFLLHTFARIPESETPAFIERFARKLRLEPYLSIDEFAADNPSFAAALAPLISGVLVSSLYRAEKDARAAKRKDLSFEMRDIVESHSKTTVTIRNWVRDFCGQCFSELRGTKPLKRIDVVSFNYDRLFETIIREVWTSPEVPYPSVDECFSFQYPYGALSNLPPRIAEPEKFIIDESAHIRSMFSGADKGHAFEIQNSQKAISGAEEIFLLGFHCHPMNVQTIGLDKAAGKIYAQNYGGDRGLARLLADLDVHSGEVATDRLDRLVSDRFFDRTPRWKRERRAEIEGVAKS